MALIPAPVDFTDKDYDALLARLQNLARSVFPRWTDYNRANVGNVLLGEYAHVVSILTYYQDNQADEAQFAYCRQRRSILSHVKLTGYVPRGAKAFQVDVTVTLDAIPANNVTFTVADTKASTAEIVEPVIFQLLEDFTIVAGANPPEATATFENSELQEDNFTSTGLSNQEFKLTKTPYLDDSLTITAGDGVYTLVDNFLLSTSTSRHAQVIVDDNDRATVRFGDGTRGAIPSVGNINFAYKTGGGETGRIEAGAIQKLIGSFTDVLGNPVNVSATNEDASSGGQDRETLEEIRTNAPASLRVLERCVAREDFEIAAKEVSGVSRALMITKNEDPAAGENRGFLYIVPTGGGAPTGALLTEIYDYIQEEKPPTLTFTLYVVGAIYKTINISARIWLKQGHVGSTVKATILANLQGFFALTSEDADGNLITNDQIDFGFNYKDSDGDPDPNVPWSDLFNVIRDSTGVRKLDDGPENLLLNGLREDVTLTVQEFPQLGTFTLYDASTGSEILDG